MVATTEVEAGPSPCVLYALATTWYDVNLPRPRSENSCDDEPERGRSMNSRPVVRPTALKKRRRRKGTLQWCAKTEERAPLARFVRSFVLAADST